MINKLKDNININTLNGSDLAYIGDAYYELYIRMYLLSKGYTKPKELHKMCTKYVSSKSHAIVVTKLVDNLNENEINAYHRGKNYNYRHNPKSSNKDEYLLSSGFESVIGYLYITKQNDRLNEILLKAIEIIEQI